MCVLSSYINMSLHLSLYLCVYIGVQCNAVQCNPMQRNAMEYLYMGPQAYFMNVLTQPH